MTTPATIGFAFALVLAVVHVAVGRITADGGPRRREALSFAGGTTVAYVFVLILPEVNEAVLRVVESQNGGWTFFEQDTDVYVVVLVGFLVFYGIHTFVTSTRTEPAEKSDFVFWTHVSSFAVYNALIGYLLFHQEESGLLSLLFYTVAMGLHFVVTDAGFRRNHGAVYHRLGRWILAGSVLFGAIVGYATAVNEAVLALLFAFLSGSIVFNVIKEELPDVEWERFASFLAGAALYTGILLAI
ncbi:hypothetical protein [Halorussus halophilus]|uniref:hypothetical protein n=1 Tax=Halorussus halophilus TaxID=2650975 RepID=UPI0013012CFC|nr:hypothetical protein [Halorussus halophilus]